MHAIVMWDKDREQDTCLSTKDTFAEAMRVAATLSTMINMSPDSALELRVEGVGMGTSQGAYSHAAGYVN